MKNDEIRELAKFVNSAITKSSSISNLHMATRLLLSFQMFKIRRFEDGGIVTLALSGRIEEEHLLELQKLFEAESAADPTGIALDLVDVRLVDRPSIKFLATCESRGILLKNCPSYVREWIETGRGYEQ